VTRAVAGTGLGDRSKCSGEVQAASRGRVYLANELAESQDKRDRKHSTCGCARRSIAGPVP
jgi:hypothetical protein